MEELIQLAWEKGFINGKWWIHRLYHSHDVSVDLPQSEYLCMCLLQKWIRDEHKIHVEVSSFKIRKKRVFQYSNDGSSNNTAAGFATYEEAFQYGLLSALKEIQ